VLGAKAVPSSPKPGRGVGGEGYFTIGEIVLRRAIFSKLHLPIDLKQKEA
jgi:hypothetical protein